jgi:hypothetical protein
MVPASAKIPFAITSDKAHMHTHTNKKIGVGRGRICARYKAYVY